MKFALIFAAVTLATTSVIDAAPANVPIWQDILMHDCTGGSHFMPSSPFGMSFDTSVQESIYNQFFLEILERLGCSATSTTTPSTATDVTTRYLPSVDMIMAHIFGQDSHPSGLADGTFSFWIFVPSDSLAYSFSLSFSHPHARTHARTHTHTHTQKHTELSTTSTTTPLPDHVLILHPLASCVSIFNLLF